MERNTKTTIYHLQIGDRFYKCNDKTKTVYEKVEHDTKQTRWQTYKHWAIEASVADSQHIHPSAKEMFVKAIKSDTEVIFLRHKTEH